VAVVTAALDGVAAGGDSDSDTHMNLSEIFIRRPIATSLLMAGIALFGIVAYRALPVSDLPQVDYPTLNVNASLPGADPGTMASSVASPLERQFTTIAGLDSMTSRSGSGGTNVTLQFDLNRDIDSATVDVQTAISAVMPLLPAGMPSAPSFRKNNPNDQPILMLNLTSNTLPLSALDDYAETMIAPRISMVSGVSQVQVQGAAKYAVRVQLDPDKLHAQRIGLNEVDAALQNWNVNLPTGQLFGAGATYNIQASGQLMNAAAFRPIVVAYRRGAPVRLEQVANVIDSVENVMNGSWFYNKPNGLEGPPLKRTAITLQVMRQPGSNTIEVTDNVRALLPSFVSQLPPSVQLTPRSDRSRTIRAAFKDVQITMLITLVLVVGVIFLFLHNGSATMIPALALPFSILGTFAVMQVLHFSLNNLSMMALILSIGFVVDDAIVMLENIVRHMENGESPLEAALKGSKEIGFTILTMTTSLAAVFIPILFMSGILGRLFREFAVTITTAILISGVVSVTLTPMLCSRFLRVVHSKKGFAGLMDRAFDALLHGGAASSPGDAGGVRRRRRGDGPDVQDHADRVHSRSGQRLDVRQPAGAAGHVVLRHGEMDAAGRRRRHPQQVRRLVSRQRRRRPRRRLEQRPDHGAAGAARAARSHRAADRAAAPPATAPLSGLPRLRRPAAVAADRRPHGQPELQHDDAEHEHRRPLQVGAGAAAGNRV
jgi:hydrophobic/amphiphilic exporter-1 (mainly G- bacteria), HAE1 family